MASDGASPDANIWPYCDRWCEFESFANTLNQRMREGSLGPDDAAAWARIAAREARNLKLIVPEQDVVA